MDKQAVIECKGSERQSYLEKDMIFIRHVFVDLQFFEARTFVVLAQDLTTIG